MKKLGFIITTVLTVIAIAPGLPAFAVGAPTSVAVVTNSAADAATNAGAAKVTWTEVADADSYAVVATSSGQTTRTGSTSSCALNTCTSYVVGLNGGSAYGFVVTAVDTGTGFDESAVSVNFTAQTIPTAPTVSAPTVTDGQVTLTWVAPTSTGGLSISEYVVTDGSGNTATKAPGSSTHTFSGLTNGTGYSFTVKAKNALGFSQATSFSIATPVSVPSTPARPTVTNPDSTSVTATWIAPATGGSAITGYKVYLLKAGVASASDEAVGSGTLTKTFSGLSDGSYTVQVIATNSIGDSTRSNQSGTVALGSSVAQTVTFNKPADKTFPGSFTLGATATSALVVTYASTTAATCTVSGAVLTLVGAGTCTITASQAGDGTFNAAIDVSKSFTITGVAAAPPSGGGGGGAAVAPVDAATPTLTTASVKLTAGKAAQKTVAGANLGLVTSAKVGTTSVTVIEASSGYLILSFPKLDAGTYDLDLTYGTETQTFTNFVVIEEAEEEAEEALVVSPSAQKVKAGSFKGYVAIYAKGYEGQRLSAKIGNDWVIVPALKSRFERITDFTGMGYQIRVRIYIDRVLEATINLTTK
jgi:hypothetical protein